MQDKQDRVKRVTLTERSAGQWYSQNRDLKVEEEKEKRIEQLKKIEAQKKWKEIWDAESTIRRLKASAEQGIAHLTKSPGSRRVATGDVLGRSRSQPGIFVTSEGEEATPSMKYKGSRNYTKKAMWSNKVYQ